jgi:hypothetical protein
LDTSVRALQLDIEGLLKLLGGTESERERFWEIWKGITSRQVATITEAAVDSVAAQVKSVLNTAKVITENAKALSAE